MILEYSMLFIATGLLATVFAALVDHWRYPALPPGSTDRKGDGGDQPMVTVIVPARNEEHNIEGCVMSVLNQTWANVRMIVVDDQSTDRTGELLDDMAASDDRLTVIKGQQLPDGWVGKGWALYQGHMQAEGEWIILLDADVRLEPWAVEQVVHKAESENIDFLNPWPRFVNVTFWERVMQPLLWGMVRIRFPLIFVNQRFTRRNMAFGMAFGPMILVRKSAYDAIDGHRHVAMDILEDVALAKLMRNRGYRTMVVNGKNICRVRMYQNLDELMNGWIKTAYGAMNYNLPMMLLATVGLFYAAFQPMLTTAYGVATDTQIWIQLGILQMIGILLRRLLDHKENDFPLWTILLHPLALTVVHYMQFKAVWQYYFGSYTWKDRDYTKPPPADPDVEITHGLPADGNAQASPGTTSS